MWNLTQLTPITVETVSANSKLFKQMSLCSMGLHCRSIRIKEAGYSIVVAITIKYQNEIRTILLTTLFPRLPKICSFVVKSTTQALNPDKHDLSYS